MRVIAVVSRDLEKGSTRYRLVQYQGFLAERGVSIEFVRPGDIDSRVLDEIRGADLLFNQKCLLGRSLSRRLIAASRRVVFDFDDAIYTRPGRPYSLLTQLKVDRRFHFWLRGADLVTTANEYLAEKARDHSATATVVPMALDLEAWKPKVPAPHPSLTIGWAGAPVNLPLLERLDPVFKVFLQRHPTARLAVFSGRKPRLTAPFSYHEFDPQAEPNFIRSLDIGLLPLADDEFMLGKSPIKAIQYLASGLPVIGNFPGATGEILDESTGLRVDGDNGWLPALERLALNRDLREQLGRSGRRKAEANHSLLRVGELLYGLIKPK